MPPPLAIPANISVQQGFSAAGGALDFYQLGLAANARYSLRGTKMDLPPVDKHAIAAFRRFYTLLPRSTDAALVVLKTHLPVEEQVKAYVDERVASSASLKQADLSCHQAIWLAEALCTDEIHPNIWEAARKLNELRNKIAHNLEPAGILERMSNFCTLIGLSPQTRAATAPSPLPSPLEDFEFAASMLYNEIALYVKRKPAEVLQLVHSAQSAP